MTVVRAVWDKARWTWDHSLGWVLTWVLVLPIMAYQRTISPMLPPTCRYHPSCSRYAVTALQVHGPIKGLGLATWRLLRCNPWSLGGLDPVPARGEWRPDILPDGRLRPSEQPTLHPAPAGPQDADT